MERNIPVTTTTLKPCIVKRQNKPAHKKNSSLARWVTSFNALILFHIC